MLVDALADMWRVSGTFVGGVPLVGGFRCKRGLAFVGQILIKIGLRL